MKGKKASDSGLAYLLFFVVAMASVLAIFSYTIFLMTQAPSIGLSDYIQTGVMVTAIIAILVSYRLQNKNQQLQIEINNKTHDKQYELARLNLDHKDSQEHLNRSIDIINKAYETIKGQNGFPSNNRVDWVTCARLLSRGMTLSEKILSEEHKGIFESEHDFQRYKFNRLLSYKDKDLPMTFF